MAGGGFKTGFEGGAKFNSGPGGKFQTGFEKGGLSLNHVGRFNATPPQGFGGGDWLSSKLSLAGHTLEGIPGGTYQALDTAVYQPWKNLITTGHPYAHHAGQNIDKLTNQTINQSVQAVVHPLRNPLLTALTISPVLDVAGRAGEIAAGVDKTAPRLLKTGEGDFSLSPPSKSATGRIIQKSYDAALQHAIDRNPEGRIAGHAMHRIGGQILEAERAKQAMRATVADVLQRSGKGLGRADQAALRLASENITPDEARLFHEQQAAAGVNAAKHLGWAKVYRDIAARKMLTQDEHGNVVVNAALHPKLAHVDGLVQQAQREGEQIIHQHELMTDQGARTRINAPGEQVRGEGRQGRGFVTEKPLENKAPKTGAARASSPVIGEPRGPISAKMRTGAERAAGDIPDNTTRLVAQNLRGLQRYANTHELRQRWLDTSSATRRTSHDILIREPGTQKVSSLPAEIEDLLGRKKLTLEELVGAHEGARSHLEDIIPGLRDKFAADNRHMIGEQAPKGYKWVDRRVVGDYANSFQASRGKIGRGFDNLNSAITAATVYYKIGHVGTRVLTNAVTNIISGAAHPLEIAKSWRLFKSLDEATRRKAYAATGQHGFEAMPHEGTGKIGVVASAGARFWAHRADAMFRFNSIAHEARKAGYTTANAFKGFLNDLEHPENLSPEDRARVENVAKRANRESIAYDRLSDTEKRFISRAIWFYPWLKGSVTYAGRTVVEHPFKSAVLANLGAQGVKQQEKLLGNQIPSYEFGLLPLGRADAGGNVPTTDFQTFSPFSTIANLLQLPKYQAAAGNLNPAAGALLDLATRTNQYGQHSNKPLSDALQALLSYTPEFQIGSALTGHKQSKMFPESNNFLAQLERMLVGPAMPRRVNQADLAKSYGLEQTGR